MYSIKIQLATDNVLIPKKTLLKKWAIKALHKKMESAEITIRIVGCEEMKYLNSTYRLKSGTTNVLSFPLNPHENIDMKIPLLGDIIICADVVNREAQEQNKSLESHWAHMVLHGVLHLLGFDHENDKDASEMELLEIKMMRSLGFMNPYESL